MKIKKGDKVLVITGKYRNKVSSVLRAFPSENKVIVDNVNLMKKHIRPKKTGEKGKIIEMPGKIDLSNIKLICSKCKKAVRIRYEFKTDEKKGKIKVRICKKCGKEI